MKLTKKKAIRLHRELWDWLYHHPSKHKSDWPKWEYNGGNVKEANNDCLLCEYIQALYAGCDRCPLDWSPTEFCQMGGGYFDKWLAARSWQTKKKYTKIIRDLPEK